MGRKMASRPGALRVRMGCRLDGGSLDRGLTTVNVGCRLLAYLFGPALAGGLDYLVFILVATYRQGQRCSHERPIGVPVDRHFGSNLEAAEVNQIILGKDLGKFLE